MHACMLIVTSRPTENLQDIREQSSSQHLYPESPAVRNRQLTHIATGEDHGG
jgi:hypothetical protein